MGEVIDISDREITPEENLEARILLCDPNMTITPGIVAQVHNRFHNTKEITPDDIKHLLQGILPHFSKYNESINDNDELNNRISFIYGDVEYTIVDTVSETSNTVRNMSGPDEPPHFSLIVYDGNQMAKEKKEGSAKWISRINKYDNFMPQIILGDKLSQKLISQCINAGRGSVRYARNMEGTTYEIKNIFRRSHGVSNSIVVKIGGSLDDKDIEDQTEPYLGDIAETFVEVHKEQLKLINKGKIKTKDQTKTIFTFGGGQRANIAKKRRAKYRDKKLLLGRYPKRIANALIELGEEFVALAEDEDTGDSAITLHSSGAFYYIGPELSFKKMHAICIAPHYIMARDGIPLADSDTHTFALAEYAQSKRVILLKRTDGIYELCPYRGFELNPETGKCADLERWRTEQINNKRISEITAEELLNGRISREGTDIFGYADGTGDHLVEDSGLIYLLKCPHIKEVIIAHIHPREMHFHWKDNDYIHVVENNVVTIDPTRGWKGFHKDRIRDAILGISYSKIINNAYQGS